MTRSDTLPGVRSRTVETDRLETHVLEAYADSSGAFEEVALAGVGHTPHVEAPVEFLAHLEDRLEG